RIHEPAALAAKNFPVHAIWQTTRREHFRRQIGLRHGRGIERPRVVVAAAKKTDDVAHREKDNADRIVAMMAGAVRPAAARSVACDPTLGANASGAPRIR